jgi:hypothetical protein
VERGKQVIVGLNQVMEVADHDFTRTSIIPSVVFNLDLPEDLKGSFYRGKVSVRLKEKCFEPSSPLGHVTELWKLLKNEGQNKEILCLHTDDGPDHRCTYYSVKLALICLFLKEDKDIVVAVRTPPYNSWKDPAERIMSILNIGLQSIGLARCALQDNDLEEKLKRCNNMKQIRDLAIREADLKEELKRSVQPAKNLMEDIVKRLRLKDKFFEVFNPATENDLDEMWDEQRRPHEIFKDSLSRTPLYVLSQEVLSRGL